MEDPPEMKVESIFARDAKEKRQFPRFRADMKLEVFRLGAERAMRGHLDDVSEGGVGATLIGDLTVGEGLTIEISGSPLLRPVRATATVRNRNAYRYGFQFMALSREQRTLITAACLFLAKV
ncbi:MAG: PilZ domain-containing protein [Candidatus Koribacter versatilis]|uniref:PilZ domain-containing protein n=1 Tax=Candidatus Korobacter versatilis TaxID=658062 RepID=A0A932A918_9BACT|nr:PilZ domain-containing protein [Candidatus Koribacter versatilis]